MGTRYYKLHPWSTRRCWDSRVGGVVGWGTMERSHSRPEFGLMSPWCWLYGEALRLGGAKCDVPLSDHELGDLRMSLMGHVMTGSEKDEAIKLFLCLTNELIERRRDAELFAKLERVAEDVIATRDQRKRYAEELQKDAFLEPKA